MAKPGRKSAYDTVIAPHLDEIKKACEEGATVKEIAKAFGISVSTLNKYKSEKKDLSDAFTHGRARIVIKIRGALLKKALGYDYTETRTKRERDRKGEFYIETYTKHQPPSETAAAMLLRNYDKDWIDRDNATTELREKEHKLRKAVAKDRAFDELED